MVDHKIFFGGVTAEKSESNWFPTYQLGTTTVALNGQKL